MSKHRFEFVSRKESARAGALQFSLDTEMERWNLPRVTTMPEYYIIEVQGYDLVFVLHSFSIPHLFKPESIESVCIGIILLHSCISCEALCDREYERDQYV
jgi:hypothetical protein